MNWILSRGTKYHSKSETHCDTHHPQRAQVPIGHKGEAPTGDKPDLRKLHQQKRSVLQPLITRCLAVGHSRQR